MALAAVVSAAGILSSCSDEPKASPVRTSNMGERVTLGHIVYTVFETQWLTHLGEGADARVPQNRYFLVRLSAVNVGTGEVIVPNFKVEDDSGNSYPELGGDQAQGVPQYIGYLRRVKPAESAQGHAVFDCPPRHYRLKIMDEDSERMGYVDIPLSFTSESPEVPQVGDTKKDQPKVTPAPGKK